jgi:hypothetical protein
VNRNIPTTVIAVVAEAMSARYSHAEIDRFMRSAGISMEVDPSKNRESKTRAWLAHANKSMDDPLTALGLVITELMETRPGTEWETDEDPFVQKVDRILTAYKLSYKTGGQILSAGVTATTTSFQAIVQDRDLPGLEAEFERIFPNIESDPPAAVTAACALLEALFKTYIEQENLEMPSDQTLKPLWKVVRKDLNFDPGLLEDDDLKAILSGLAAIVEGAGALRTHKGSAHGRSKKTYKLKPRHARLAAHAAFTLASFVLETWDSKRNERP